MLLVAFVSALLVGVVMRLSRDDARADGPQRLASHVVHTLPAPCADWGAAMIAELAHVRQRRARWRFASGVVRTVVVVSLRQRVARSVAVVGLVVACGLTVLAAVRVPSLVVFSGVLGVLLVACGTWSAAQSTSHVSVAAPLRLLTGVTLLGVGGCVVAVVRVAVAHPSATTDRYHVVSVLFAAVLTGYVMLARLVAGLANGRATVWWVLAGVLASNSIWLVAALRTHSGTGEIAVLLWPVGAATTLVVAAAAARPSGSVRLGLRAGVLAALIGAPIHFVIEVTRLLAQHQYMLTNPYDVAAFPHSGYPDVASYVLSDAVAGDIVGGLLLYPLTMLLVAMVGASIGAQLRRRRAASFGRPIEI